MSTLISADQRRADGAGIEVRAVAGRHDRLQFVRLPWSIYRDDPQWVPPLEVERLEFIDPRKHPFYRHAAAALFLALRRGVPVGRILASDDPNFNAEHALNAGSFGMFESGDDQHVAHALLETAADWLRARGRTQIIGPIDYSTNYACGLLVEGFDTPPRVMMNHNPPYYARLLESWGLERAKDLWSWWFTDPHDMVSKWRRRTERAVSHGIVVRPMDRRDMPAEIARCKLIYNTAWEKHWGFVPMTDAEFGYYAQFLSRWAIPGLLLMAEVAGQPVGFSIALPDFNEAVRPLNGRLTRWGLPIGLVRLLRNLKRIRTARLLSLGVLEPFRRRGVAELLILRTLDYGKNVQGYTCAELGWTLEDNQLINRAITAVGGHVYKRYRIYQKSIG